MNIKSIYLKNITQGYKTHEYRLNKDKYKNINIGDHIMLIANEDNNYTELVEVVNIKHYESFKDALRFSYRKDFKGIYKTLNEAVAACNEFYNPEDIEEKGVIVFTIRKVNEPNLK